MISVKDMAHINPEILIDCFLMDVYPDVADADDDAVIVPVLAMLKRWLSTPEALTPERKNLMNMCLTAIVELTTLHAQNQLQQMIIKSFEREETWPRLH